MPLIFVNGYIFLIIKKPKFFKICSEKFGLKYIVYLTRLPLDEMYTNGIDVGTIGKLFGIKSPFTGTFSYNLSVSYTF